MMNTSAHMIDLGNIEGNVFTGRDRGERLRETYGLDNFDKLGEAVVVKIPDRAYTVSSSFFLGLFGPSVVQAGSKDAFYARYKFNAPAFLLDVLDGYVSRALQTRKLFS